MKRGTGSATELLDRLQADPAFAKVDFARIASDGAKAFVGRSPEQVAEFLAEHVDPIRKHMQVCWG